MSATTAQELCRRFALVDECTSARPLALAVRLEAFYQHYARFTVMAGSEPMGRAEWWAYVLAESDDVSALIALEREHAMGDAVGALM